MGQETQERSGPFSFLDVANPAIDHYKDSTHGGKFAPIPQEKLDYLRRAFAVPATVTIRADHLEAIRAVSKALTELAEAMAGRSLDTCLVEGRALRPLFEAAQALSRHEEVDT